MARWCLECRVRVESGGKCPRCGGAGFALFPGLDAVTVPVDAQRLPDEADVAYAVRVYGTPEANLCDDEPGAELLALVPPRIAVANRMVPLKRGHGSITLAMVDPSNILAIDEIQQRTGLEVEVMVASEASVAAALARWYGA